MKDIKNNDDIISVRHEIIMLRQRGVIIADMPEQIKELVWQIVYHELKNNAVPMEIGKEQRTSKITQSIILEKMLGLPKDVFGKKYWNMYSPDSRMRQERYYNVQLPFNYAQVECNAVYRAMLHHMITYADVPVDTIADIFGKFGLVMALCADGYKYKIVCLNEHDCYLYSLLQDVLKKPVSFYKQIDRTRKYLQIKLADNDIKDIMEAELQKLGTIRALLAYGIQKDVNGQFSYESTGYTKEQIAARIFISLCFAPEYWVETNLEMDDNNTITGWIDDKKTYKKRVEAFVKLTQNDFVIFAKKFQELKFISCDCRQVMSIIRQVDKYGVDTGKKPLLYIDVPKYIKEYRRFGFNGSMMLSLLKMLAVYESNWIMTWSTFLQKGFSDENKTPYDMLYTEQKMLSEIYMTLKEDEPVHEKVPVRVIYNMFDKINANHSIYVFIHRDKDKNKQQNIAFITNIDFKEITAEEFFRKYKIQYKGDEKLLKLGWKEFRKKYIKFS